MCLLAALTVMAISAAPASAAPADGNGPPAEDLDRYPIAAGQDEGAYGSLSPGGPNQTYASGATAAEYRQSSTPTFTRDVPVLPAGQRLQTLGATCAVDEQGVVHCQTAGNHGFVLSTDHGVPW